MTKEQRSARNMAKLAELHPVIARKAAAVIRDLEGHGWQPLIVEAWRDPIVQARKKAQGVSKIAWGFHCATSIFGQPQALAFDLVDARYLWNTRYLAQIKEFTRLLVSSCEAHALLNGSGWKSFGPLGDWAHCEVTGITIGEARKGKRPS